MRPPPTSPRRRQAIRRIAVSAALLLAACGGRDGAPAGDAQAQPLTVFAAASLKESMDAAADAFTRDSGQPVQVSYAGSTALARQLERRAPADVFVSADSQWMDWLQERGLIDPDTRSDLLGNTLVLIAPAE